jgi:tRNA U55 pseudouridine synthase TruB
MQRYFVIEKRVGYTPLQELEVLKGAAPELAQVPLTYAGRLDPMASGKLLVLVGDECKKRRQYEKLDKEYEFEVLLGFKTDTGDVLGVADASSDEQNTRCHFVACGTRSALTPLRGCGFGPRTKNDTGCSAPASIARSLIGKHAFPYPAFSSKTVQGKPLFEYALAGTLDTIQIPTIDVHIYRMEYLGKRVVPRDILLRDIADKIQMLQVEGNTGRVAADFRKDEITDRWRQLLDSGTDQYEVLRFKTTVSSGTYIRTLSSLIAQKLGTEGLAYSILRTRIGRYQPFIGRLGFWRRTF